MSAITRDEHWMTVALALARQAAQADEVPVGAVCVFEDRQVSAAYNQTLMQHDATAHAEVLALRQAMAHMNNHRLSGVTLYVTLEPCLMCLGALVQARVDRVVYGASDEKYGGCLHRDDLPVNHRFQSVLGGVCATEAQQLLKDFFAQKR